MTTRKHKQRRCAAAYGKAAAQQQQQQQSSAVRTQLDIDRMQRWSAHRRHQLITDLPLTIRSRSRYIPKVSSLDAVHCKYHVLPTTSTMKFYNVTHSSPVTWCISHTEYIYLITAECTTSPPITSPPCANLYKFTATEN